MKLEISSVKEKLVPINMRVNVKKRTLIDVAASMLGQTRTGFIVDAASQKAENVILDRRLFVIDNAAFDLFEKALESSSIKTNHGLNKLLASAIVWN